MKKFSLSLLFGFIANNLVGTLVAMFVLNPITHEAMVGKTRSQDELEMPSLLAGYFILTLIMVLAFPYFKITGSWLKKGVVWGVVSGGMAFLSVYLIIAGWSILPPKEMFISGIVDISSTIAAGIVIAYFYKD
ncbi:MAG: hypothetical protein HRT66_01410 [Flavobacteriaceae bacterium]|nr:hypothetical protein [Flavobacteriaceae bacterium]